MKRKYERGGYLPGQVPVGYVPSNHWPDDMVEFLRKEVKLGHSNGVISRAINAETGPGQRWAKLRKTPSAVGGKIDRLGIAHERPVNIGRPPKDQPVKATRDARLKPAKVPYAGQEKRPSARRKPKPENAMLRAEDTTASEAMPPSRNPGGNRITQGRPPSFLMIAEDTPSALDVKDAGEATCMWPASDDVRDMRVCGAPATIGAYCDHHASKAYRVMPTNRRNAGYRRPNEDWKIGNPKVEQG